MIKIRNIILLVVLFILNGSCLSNSSQLQNESELAKRLNRVNEILVMDILGRIDTPEFWWKSYYSGYSYSGYSWGMVEFLVENKDISLPLIFEKLDRDGAKAPPDWAEKSYGDYLDFILPRTPWGVKNHQLAAFFYVFWKAKSIESIPYLCEFLRSIPKRGMPSEGMNPVLATALRSIMYAELAVCNITDHKVKLVYYNKQGDIEGYSYEEIADQAEKWYAEHKDPELIKRINQVNEFLDANPVTQYSFHLMYRVPRINATGDYVRRAA